MNTALDISQLLSAAALVATLAVVIWYTVKTSEMAAATREMAKANQEQRYDQLRPLLIPEGDPAFQDEYGHGSWLSTTNIDEQGYSMQRLSIRNVGVGPALNVISVLGSSESYVVGNTGTPTREAAKHRWMGRLGKPLVPNEEAECIHIMGNERKFSKWADTGDLNAPPEPTLAHVTREHMPVHAARMTITYHDVFGRKHRSVFDYVQRWRGNPAVYEDLKRHGGWELVEFSAGVASDLNDMVGTPPVQQVEVDVPPQPSDPDVSESISIRDTSANGLV